MITCTATFHQGDQFATVTGQGVRHEQAFYDAALLLPRGLRVSDTNLQGGITLLTRWQRGEYGGMPFASPVQEGYAYLAVTDDLSPEISIGWVTFRFAEVKRRVKLWAVAASVKTEDGPFSGSRQVPIFYLDPGVQGILDATGAERVAFEILHAVSGGEPEGVSITVEPLY